MCDWRKLPWRVTSRPEIEISDKRLAFSTQTSSIEPSYKTGPKQVKMSISPIAQVFLKIYRVQNVALTVRRPKHPSLVWCTTIFLYETFSRLVPRDSNLGHHTDLHPSITEHGAPGVRPRGPMKLLHVRALPAIQGYMYPCLLKPSDFQSKSVQKRGKILYNIRIHVLNLVLYGKYRIY
jgi:hypothetical protein